MGLDKIHALKDLRRERGLTQKQCAYYVGVTKRQYINWEQGNSVIPVNKFKRLADYLQIELKELFVACFEGAEKEEQDGT